MVVLHNYSEDLLGETQSKQPANANNGVIMSAAPVLPAYNNNINNVNDNRTAQAVLICRPNSHPFQERKLSLDQPVKIGRSVARARPAPNNAVFDCKVLSRNHAVVWYETTGKVSIFRKVYFCRALFRSDVASVGNMHSINMALLAAHIH